MESPEDTYLLDSAQSVERFACPMCLVPPGSPCRTRGGAVAPKYHTPRFQLVARLREELEVLTPADRRPGHEWRPGPVTEEPEPESDVMPTRIGYARCSTAGQELQSQLDALELAGCNPIFHEKISTRVKVRPQFQRTMEIASTIKTSVPQQRVIITVHELKRLARNTVELLGTAETLRQQNIELELLTGPLQGIYDPTGYGSLLFAFFAAVAETERGYIREKTIEGQFSARARGRHGGRPAVMTPEMTKYAQALAADGLPLMEISRQLVIPSGKAKGQNPSAATVSRALARASREAANLDGQQDAQQDTGGDGGTPPGPRGAQAP